MIKTKKIKNSIGKTRLYARVGLAGMTPKRAYNMIRYWIKTNILGQNIPWLMELSVTYKCQCRCVHCSVGEYLDEANKKQTEELTTKQMKSILEQAHELGIPKVDFFGGEPLVRSDIVELTNFGAKRGLYMSITTNAWSLTKEMVKKLKQAGISCINISLDSVSEEKHDSLRRLPGVYKKALEGARLCHEAGIPCIISTYVTHDRIKNFGTGATDNSQLKQIIDLAKDLKASGIRILFPILSGRWERDAKQEFTEEEKSLVIENLDHSFAFIEGAYSVKNGKKVCQSLSGKMFNVSPYGDIQLCITFPQLFANLKEVPLKEALKKMYNHPIYTKNKDGSCCSATGLRE